MMLSVLTRTPEPLATIFILYRHFHPLVLKGANIATLHFAFDLNCEIAINKT